MEIIKIIVDEKPQRCGDCKFCEQFYFSEREKYYYTCLVTDKDISDTEQMCNCCDILEEQCK